MSLHIQTATGLLEIGGSVTKEKIIEALGYVPADSENLLDNIVEDNSGNLVISDNNGNIIMKVDAEGVHTTEVTANGILVGETIIEHITDSSVHVTLEEKSTWDNKSDFSGFYADLPDAPNIAEDNSGEVVYADESGNVILKINENGLETTQVIANNIISNGANITTKLDTLSETISSHADDADKHISAEERIYWNGKASTTYVDEKVASIVNSAPEALDTLNELAAALGNDENFATTVTNSLAEKANKTDLDALKDELSESIVSESKEWIVTDENGNIIARVDDNGLETTTVTAQAVVINGEDVQTAIDEGDNASLESAKAYTDEKIAAIANAEMIENQINNLNQAITNKADKNYETWMFTLADGTVIEKQVLINA